MKSDDDKNIGGVNVLLLNSKDSVLVKGTVTKGSGDFSFDIGKPGDDIICTSLTGFKQQCSNNIAMKDKSELDAGIIQLTKDAIQLDAVTLVSKKPLFEQKIDRVVTNIKEA